MSYKNVLKYQLMVICKHNRYGSYVTQADRRATFRLIADQLSKELGFKGLTAKGLKMNHVTALVSLWKKKQVTVAVIKNRMSALRFWSRCIGKAGLIPEKNDAPELRIEKRKYTTNIDKSISLGYGREALEKVRGPFSDFIKNSLVLQEQFGLRRKEALLVRLHMADKVNHLHLEGSWCKGNRKRDVPISTPEQRKALDEIKAFVQQESGKNASMIPNSQNYKQQRKRFENQTRKAGISKTHGLRHLYCQHWYEKLIEVLAKTYRSELEFEQQYGWVCPAKGGPSLKSMSKIQRKLDRMARNQITEWIGHSRIEVLNIYLGR